MSTTTASPTPGDTSPVTTGSAQLATFWLDGDLYGDLREQSKTFYYTNRSGIAIDDKFRGTESLFRHAAGTGKCPRKPSPSTPPPQSCSVSSSPMDYGF